MKKFSLRLDPPGHFNLWRTVFSHGWCTLLPFRVDKDKSTLERILRLDDGTIAKSVISDSSKPPHVEISTHRNLSRSQRGEVRNQLTVCLRLDEDLSEFYDIAAKLRKFRWVPGSGAGRLLRSPTVFEDTVKIICTTNCSWSLTQSMVKNLTEELGEKFSDGESAFPTPESIAGVSETFMRKKIRAGYRSPYLLELAERVAEKSLDIESWRHSSLSTEELFREVHSVKGIGDYAAGNLLRLLGRYDYLALDSWVRTQYAEVHHGGRRVSDKTIERAYRPYGKWRGLFFWLEMTKEWITRKFPF